MCANSYDMSNSYDMCQPQNEQQKTSCWHNPRIRLGMLILSLTKDSVLIILHIMATKQLKWYSPSHCKTEAFITCSLAPVRILHTRAS